MGIYFILIGMFLIYLSETFWFINCLKTELEYFDWYDYVICFIPGIRVIYFSMVVE